MSDLLLSIQIVTRHLKRIRSSNGDVWNFMFSLNKLNVCRQEQIKTQSHLRLYEGESTRRFNETRHFLLDENIYYDTPLLLCLFHMAPYASVASFTLSRLQPRHLITDSVTCTSRLISPSTAKYLVLNWKTLNAKQKLRYLKLV